MARKTKRTRASAKATPARSAPKPAVKKAAAPKATGGSAAARKAALKKNAVKKAATNKRAAARGVKSGRNPGRNPVGNKDAGAPGRRRSSAAAPRARKVTARRATTRPHASAAGARSRRSAGSLFAEGVERAMQGYAFDAIALFRDAIAADPRGPLADDALFNIGSAYLQLRLVLDAEEAFTELVERFPEATIDSVYSGNERGRTAAKGLLGRMQARLAQGDVDGARADREALTSYDDTWATDPSGRRRSFHELAVAVMP